MTEQNTCKPKFMELFSSRRLCWIIGFRMSKAMHTFFYLLHTSLVLQQHLSLHKSSNICFTQLIFCGDPSFGKELNKKVK